MSLLGNSPSSSTTTAAGVASPAPPRRVAVTVAAVIAGAVLAWAWSAELVDKQVGVRFADLFLGNSTAAIGGSLAGFAFALVSGIAGTFTACNIAVFGALPQVAGESGAGGARRAMLAPVGWLSAGMLSVAAVYGVVAVLARNVLPQLSDDVTGSGMPVRLYQSIVVFGLIGLAFLYLGAAAFGYLPDPFAGRSRARLIVLGALIGFIVGRPYPMFRHLLEYAADTGNPLFGVLAMCLQSLGNIVVMVIFALLLARLVRTGRGRWLADPGRAALVAGVATVALGTFLLLYWDVRLPARFGFGWFPIAPWNQ
jgi:cytochrome c biogenesis protein CcdA